MSLVKMIAIFLVLELLTVSCSLYYDSEIDRSFLIDQPCGAPCWYRLIPGVSSKEDVINALKDIPFIEHNSIKEYGTKWNDDDSAKSIIFACSHPMKNDCGELVISKDNLKLISLSVNFPLDIETVINKLGPPSYVDYGVYAPEVGGCIISFNWPKLNIEASNLDTRNNELCTIIDNMHYIPRKINIQSMSYTVDEAFNLEPGGCCQRIEWPGFEKP